MILARRKSSGPDRAAADAVSFFMERCLEDFKMDFLEVCIFIIEDRRVLVSMAEVLVD
jgi:hypothetical protein